MFRTEISVPPSNHKISLNDQVFSIGSCFSDCMGERFKRYKFKALANPFGTVYNPLSISKLLQMAIDKTFPSDESYVVTHGLTANFDFHSSFSENEESAVRKNIEKAIESSHHFLSKSNYLIITFGTAFTYFRKDNEKSVANCHKLPAAQFRKELLDHEAIVEDFKILREKLLNFNEEIKIILTVSPVRHTKDTITLNSVSKSILRLACHTLTEYYDNVEYFPSYEIMMDDLRDYRFYKRDMIHPSEEAEDYIWRIFSEGYFSDETLNFLPQWDDILRSINHRPFNPASEGHQKFIQNTINKLRKLEKEVNISSELKLLQRQII